MAEISRRTVLTAAAALPLARLGVAAPPMEAEPVQTGTGPFTLPPLPYGYDALEKAIDAQTMMLHHDKHHAAYVKNLNDAIAKAPPDWQKRSIADILTHLNELPADIQEAVRNNGGGHDNHSIFWTTMSPNGGGEPTGEVKGLIDRDLGGFTSFKTQFEALGTKRFGSGWVWLVRQPDEKVALVSRPNQDSPRMDGLAPIMGNDVWEHAYYLRYQNRRADYLKAWWSVVDWDAVNKRLSVA